jgi:hypothetical protein
VSATYLALVISRLPMPLLPSGIRKRKGECSDSIRSGWVRIASCSLGPSQYYVPATIFTNEDLEDNRGEFCTLDS